MSTRNKLTLGLPLLLLAYLASPACGQTSASATAGSNLDMAPSQDPIFVEWVQSSQSWVLQVDLIVDPTAGPMAKHFQTPLDSSGAPILLDGEQPFPQPLWEDFLIIPIPGTPGVPVTDWHEVIHTPGWEWVVPGDARFPDLFPANASLITRDGVPWPYTQTPKDPTEIWVDFPPIGPNHVLDVHKALLWVGTTGNRTWGDMVDDAGNTVDESFIAVWEYPTIPEPSTIVMLSLGLLGAWFVRRR